MAQNISNTSALENSSDNYYQISDDDIEECEELGDDCLLEEVENPIVTINSVNGGRGPYERAWTTDATRALIHVRGPMEGRFTEGRQKRTALWLHCTRQLQKLGYRYSAAKVQKKWHNILITYNKNLGKKYLCGYVHWEFFEEMFKYLQGKKADFEIQQHQQHQQQQQQQPQQQNQSQQHDNSRSAKDGLNREYMSSPDQAALLLPNIELDTKSNDEFDEDSTIMSELKAPKVEIDAAHLPLVISHANGFNSERLPGTNPPPQEQKAHPQEHTTWWKDYFERKLEVEREKIEQQKQMHREYMQFNKMSLVQQEKIERIKIDAINSLTSTLQKLVESRNRKT